MRAIVSCHLLASAMAIFDHALAGSSPKDSAVLTISPGEGGSLALLAAKGGFYGCSVQITARLRGKTQSAVHVPARIFSECIAVLDGAEVEISSSKNDLVISSGKFHKMRIRCFVQDVSVHVPPAVGDDVMAYTLAPEQLLVLRRMVPFAAQGDLVRTVLTGIQFDATKGGFLAHVSDGFRYCRLEVKSARLHDIKGDSFHACLPVHIFRLAGLVADPSSIVLSFGEHGAELRLENKGGTYAFSCPYISKADTPLPEYKSVLPAAFAFTAQAGRQVLDAGVRAVATVHDMIMMQFLDRRLVLSALNLESGAEASTELEVSHPALKELRICLSARYLRAALEVFHDDRLSDDGLSTVFLGYNGPASPLMLRRDKSEDVSVLVMPLYNTWSSGRNA